MTTELEKQFFETFGIKPVTGVGLVKFKEPHYPHITDRHYLELICILCKRDYDLGCCWFAISGNVEELKKYLLGDCIEYVNDIKHQVQELFKGEQ